MEKALFKIIKVSDTVVKEPTRRQKFELGQKVYVMPYSLHELTQDRYRLNTYQITKVELYRDVLFYEIVNHGRTNEDTVYASQADFFEAIMGRLARMQDIIIKKFEEQN